MKISARNQLKGTIVDVWLECAAATQWGRRPVTIYVLAS